METPRNSFVQFLNAVIIIVFTALAIFIVIPFTQQSLTTPTEILSSSQPSKIGEPNIVAGSICKGKEVPVEYAFRMQPSPFECEPFCDNRNTSPHFILYSNGFAAQCGINTCSDWGEDTCTTCIVPQDVLNKYGLPKPVGDPPCKKKASVSSSKSSLGKLSGSSRSSASSSRAHLPNPSPNPTPNSTVSPSSSSTPIPAPIPLRLPNFPNP